MAGISGLGTTFNLPNYVGELFALSTEDTPFLSAIGGLTGGESVLSTRFESQTYDLRDAASDRQRLEGADAPTAEERVRSGIYNVVEIHQEAVSVSYTKQAASQLLANAIQGHDPVTAAAGGQGNPVTNELDWQVVQALKQIARDVEKTFIVGTFADPATNANERQTRGLQAAITTNVTDANGAALTSDLVLDAMQEAWENGGISETETATLMCNAFQKRRLTKVFVSDKGYEESSRSVGGVHVTTIETDFGRLNVMLNRYMPTDEVTVVSLEECAPVFLLIPDKGFLFEEPLAKTGASEKVQIYGEIGLRYGNEKRHAKITELADTAAEVSE